MALRPGGKVKRRPGPIGKPQPTQKGVGRPKPSQKPKGRPKPGSKPKGPAGGPNPKPGTIKPKLGLPPYTKKAMGGQASEGAARGALKKKRKTARQQELMDMLKRLYGNQSRRMIVPKKKPKRK